MSASEQQSPDSLPPSFTPSGGSKRADSADAVAQHAPSFAPQSRAHRTHTNQNSSSSGTPAVHAAQNMPASFAPSHTASRAGSSNSASPTSIPPVIHPASNRPAGRARTQRNANLASARPATVLAPASGSAPRNTPRTAQPALQPLGTQRKPRTPRAPRPLGKVLTKSIAWTLVVLLALTALIGFFSINWINNHLQHRNWLTSTPSSSATSWLILGSDARDGAAGTGDEGSIVGSRTDTILLLTQPKSGNASLISLPRDSYVQPDGEDMKLNAVSTLISRQGLVNTVEDITGYKVDHVVEIGFGGVEGVVDAIGGVRLCYDGDVDDPKSGMVWSAGCHDVNGRQALAFSRMRYQDPKGDIGRQARQRQVIAAIIKKAASPGTLLSPSTLHNTATAGLGSITVDENADAFTLAKMAFAFRNATGSHGVTGTLYYTDADYYPESGIGSTVLLDDKRNTELFQQLEDGTHAPGNVGGLVGDGSDSSAE